MQLNVARCAELSSINVFCLVTGLTACMMCKVDWNWLKWARVRRPGLGIHEYFIDVVKLCERRQKNWTCDVCNQGAIRRSSGRISCFPLQNTNAGKWQLYPVPDAPHLWDQDSVGRISWSQKMLDWSLQVGSESLPQMKEFKYLVRCKMEPKINVWIDIA